MQASTCVEQEGKGGASEGHGAQKEERQASSGRRGTWRRASGTDTMPTLGSIVQNGKLAAWAFAPSQMALKRVDCTPATHPPSVRLPVLECHLVLMEPV